MVRFLIGFGVLFGVLNGLAAVGSTGWWGLLVLAAVAPVAVAVECWLSRVGPVEAMRRLGFGRPGWRALGVAVVIAALVQLAYPLTAAVTDAPSLRGDWPLMLLGVLAFHGIAEELVWRGYAFRRLREGRSFRAAVLLTMPLVALAHVPILITSGVAVGVAALLVAAVTSVPFAYLFETGRGTLWAPAVVHAGIDAFKLTDVPAAGRITFSLVLAGFSVLVPLLALAVPRRVLAPAGGPGAAGGVSR